MPEQDDRRTANWDVNPPPTIDPTALTTQALTREIAAVRSDVERQVDALNAIQHERGLRIAQQFDLVERQRVEQKQDTKLAVDAALAAQKEAVREQTTASEKAIDKSERSITELIRQLRETSSSDATTLRRELSEVKERVTSLEGQKSGSELTIGKVYGAVGAATAVVGTLILLASGVFGKA